MTSYLTSLTDLPVAVNAVGPDENVSLHCILKGGPESILGPIDALKFRSCLTLFEAVAPDTPGFSAALRQCYGGTRCPKTLALLAEGQ